MQIFVGVKQTDLAQLKSVLNDMVTFVVWPNSHEKKRDLLSEELGVDEGEEKCYIHFSGYKKLSFKELSVFRGKCINIHPAPPSYPGVGGINLALYNGDATFGVTVHLMDEKIDHGRILDVSTFPLHANMTIEGATQVLFTERIRLLKNIMTEILSISFNELLKINENTKYVWSDDIYLRSKLNEMSQLFINKNSTISELDKRIKCFHTKKFPLKISINGRNFALKEI